MRELACTILFLCLAAPVAAAQDPVEVDPDHYKVLLENDQVRVLKITYGPGEKSVMHEHPATVAVFFTDVKVRFSFPDGTAREVNNEEGEVVWGAGGLHLPENLSDESLELVLVELKQPAAPASSEEKSSPGP